MLLRNGNRYFESIATENDFLILTLSKMTLVTILTESSQIIRDSTLFLLLSLLRFLPQYQVYQLEVQLIQLVETIITFLNNNLTLLLHNLFLKPHHRLSPKNQSFLQAQKIYQFTRLQSHNNK